jgi:hypothetical protein
MKLKKMIKKNNLIIVYSKKKVAKHSVYTFSKKCYIKILIDEVMKEGSSQSKRMMLMKVQQNNNRH